MSATTVSRKGVTLATSAAVDLSAIAKAAAAPVTVVPAKAVKGEKGAAKRKAAIAAANGLQGTAPVQHNAHVAAWQAATPAPVAAPAPVAVTAAPAAPAATPVASKVAARSPGNAEILAYLATYAASQVAKAPTSKCGWQLYAGLTPAAVLAVVGNNCPTPRCARRKMRAHLKALLAATPAA